MTTQKPNPVARLVKGKSPYVIANLCETVNWLVSCMENLSANAGIGITGVNSGRPKIGAKIVEGDNISIDKTPKGSIKISATSSGIKISCDGIDLENIKELEITPGPTSASSSQSVVFNVTNEGDNKAILTAEARYID